MALSLLKHRSFFDNTVYKVIEEMEKIETNPIFDLYGELPYDSSTGDTLSFTSRTLDGFSQRVAPGGQIPEVNVTEGDTLSKTFVSYKDKMVVEMETALHNKLDLVLEDAQALAERNMNIIALEMTHQLLTSADSDIINLKGGGTAAITCADGQPLASANHTVAGTGAKTYSNLLASEGKLSSANVSTLIQQANDNNVSDQGTLVPFNADIIIIPRNELMRRKAMEISMSDLTPETSNNAVNVYSGGRFKIYELGYGATNSIGAPDSTQQYHWAIADSRQLKRALKYSWALRPTEVGTGLVPKFREHNLDSTIYSAGRCVFGAPRWQGIYFSMSKTAPTID